jgi:hypothetical protein
MHIATRIRTGTTGVNCGAPINGDLPLRRPPTLRCRRAKGAEQIKEHLETNVIAS